MKSFGHVRYESSFHNMRSSEKCVHVLGKEARGFCFVHVCQSVVLSLCGGWVFLRPCHHLKGFQWRSVDGLVAAESTVIMRCRCSAKINGEILIKCWKHSLCPSTVFH